uniref:Sensor histidine kinase n=2 Tax=Thermotoga petrophila TaxID=93929 RepID=Q5CBI2_9THEM|nr:sensor histidine kinase [Thermotoga petrophila RKU-1]
MVVMYFFFPETTNVVVVSVLNFVALFLSFFTHYTSSRKDEDLNVLTFSCLLSSLFSLFFLRVFLMNPENAWMFLSSSKLILAEGSFLFLIGKKKNYFKWLVVLTFVILFAVSVLRFNLVFYFESVSLALFSLLLLIKKPQATLLSVSLFLYSISSIFFYFFRSAYPYHVTSGSIFLMWHFVKKYVETPKKEAEKLSKELGIPPERISSVVTNLYNFLIEVLRIIPEILREEDQNRVREIFNKYFSQELSSCFPELRDTFSNFVEEYVSFLEEKQKFQDMYVVLTKNLAHNLKNPVNAIYVSAQLLKRQFPETSPVVRNIEKLCHEMTEEIERILKASIGRNEVLRKDDLEKALEPLLEMARLKNLETDIEMEFDELEIDRDAFHWSRTCFRTR